MRSNSTGATSRALFARALGAGIFVVSAAISGTGQAFAAPVGMACQVTGKPDFKAGAGWKPLRLLQRLEAGDAVRCGAGESAIIVLFGNGRRYRVAGGGEAQVQTASVSGATPLGGASAPSANAARALSGARVGAVMARPGVSHERLTPESTGWIVPAANGSYRLAWSPANAATYSFTLLDASDDFVWNERLQGRTETTLSPAAAALVQKRQPYVWQLVTYGKSGKPHPKPRWGIVTFLDAADAAKLTQEAAPLLQESKQNPADPAPRALLAELYRSYGVYAKTLEELEALRHMKADGAVEALGEAYSEISPSAYGRWLLLQDDERASAAAAAAN